MAKAIDRDHWDPEDFAQFARRLQEDLEALALVLGRPGFGVGPPSLGAELELSLAGPDGAALPVGPEVRAAVADPRVAPELNRFNVEINLSPVPAAGRPFTALATEMRALLSAVDAAAVPFGGRVVPIGILPTLTPDDLHRDALTDLPRYRALSYAIRTMRGGPADLRIDGDDPLHLVWDDVTIEGANTSFQVHLRVDPADFAATYNAAQLASPVALAVGTNSPVLLGHRLWEETRIALFKKSLDERLFDPRTWNPPARVSFGHGWVRCSAWELFAESVGLHTPLFPVWEEERPGDVARGGGIPPLSALRLHQGTVWRWNRAIYDPADGGHLRIEFRILPSGPTPIDMMASAAFLVGLTAGLAPEIDALTAAFPFRYADYNFYRAAQDGLEATLLWPSTHAPSPRPVAAADLAHRLLPVARNGLRTLGVDEEEIGELLGVIEGRLATGRTGSRWQRQFLAGDAPPDGPRLARMLERYLGHARSGVPVHAWPAD